MSAPHLSGTWHPIRAELDGEQAPALALERMELRLTADTYAIVYAEEIHDAGNLASTATTLLLTAQRGPHAGRVVPAIYQLAGDRLRICFGLDGTAPAAFATAANSRRYLVTYRRRQAQDLG